MALSAARLTTRVVNVRLDPWRSDPASYVYVGRPGKGRDSIFGNPFSVTQHGIAALAKFRVYFLDRVQKDLDFYDAVMALEGKCLGCFCVDEDGLGACHAKTIAAFVDEESARLSSGRLPRG